MTESPGIFRPPFCPNPTCRFHCDSTGWRHKKHGFHLRAFHPQRIQRYQCLTCKRSFSYQTFQTSYWLKRPDLLEIVFTRSVSGSGFRQIARELAVSHNTIAGQIARLGRHCLLFQQQFRDRAPLDEPLAADGFETFELSQYFPCHFHVVAGTRSHFFHVFTDSELRRKGRMTAHQKIRRAQLEKRFGRPDPQSIRKEFAEVLRLLPGEHEITLNTDEHPAYARAISDLDRVVIHHTTSSKELRSPRNPLFAANLLDLIFRHCNANHRRETIAFSKRRQSAAERMAILQVWRNFIKQFSERNGGGTPAQRLGILDHALTAGHILHRRLFPSRVKLPPRLMRYYRREIVTRCIPNGTVHQLNYAF